MTIQAVRATKTSKTFYRNSFRKIITLLIVSLIINGLLAFLIYNKLISEELPDYYATSGITAPTKLNYMDKPNNSSEAILQPAPITDGEEAMMTYG